MPTAAAAALPPSAPAVSADPSWEMYSSLNGAAIVPGAAVHAALGQIAAASDILRAGTWGSGGILGGLASVAPQVFLAQADWALRRWQDSIEDAKSTVLDTAGVPVVHQLAQLSLLTTLLLPTAGGLALGGAALTIPLVGLFGAPEAASAAEQLVAGARQNGQVYAVVPVMMSKTSSSPNLVNEIGHVSVNKGPRSPVVFDTGSSGLSITMPYVGQNNLGPSTGHGESSYGTGSNAVRYEYDKYTTTVSFGRGIVTGATTVNIVTSQTATGFDNYQFPDGIVGVVGIGANAYSGPNLNVTLPGELKDGVLMFQFGRWGLLVFGPNPLPAVGSVPGAPAAYVQVQINDGPKSPAKGLFDSGGVNGELPASLLGTGQTSGSVPTGTRISVYTADGNTLLYSYTTTAANTPEVTTSDIFNTGNAPFQRGPVYFDYSQSDGIGTTVFSYF
ncbi:MAG: PecA family PE domain-processing aspartic protease [Mycobacterium sp.]|nr:PecA family PE domain-processing aspartic protease [Mycobacterium sp.]